MNFLAVRFVRLRFKFLVACIKLEPVAVYSKDYMMKLAKEIQVLREDPSFAYETFDQVDDLLKSLEKKD